MSLRTDCWFISWLILLDLFSFMWSHIKEREKSVRAGDKSQEMMIGTVRLSIQLWFLFICWIKRQSFTVPIISLASRHIKEEEKWMIDRAHIKKRSKCGHRWSILIHFLFLLCAGISLARLSFPFRRAIHLQMTSWGSIALLLKRKWKRKSFVTVGKTWLIIKWKEPSKAWSQRDEVLFSFYNDSQVPTVTISSSKPSQAQPPVERHHQDASLRTAQRGSLAWFSFLSFLWANSYKGKSKAQRNGFK